MITDMHMPDMDGQEFARILRQRALAAKIVLVTSGSMPTGEDAKVFDARLLKAVSKDDLKRPAPRPASSKLACLVSEPLGLAPLQDWEDALKKFLSEKE